MGPKASGEKVGNTKHRTQGGLGRTAHEKFIKKVRTLFLEEFSLFLRKVFHFIIRHLL